MQRATTQLFQSCVFEKMKCDFPGLSSVLVLRQTARLRVRNVALSQRTGRSTKSHELHELTLTSNSCDFGFVFVRVNSWIVPLPYNKGALRSL